MPIYTFKLRDGSGSIDDEAGVRLPTRANALSYAYDVACELMNCREQKTRHWRPDVYEDGRECVFIIPFARIDSSLNHLMPELRSMVERSCDRLRALNEVMAAARVTVREARALVARSRDKPYLATCAGQETIRPAR
jgi:hypothetical protein